MLESGALRGRQRSASAVQVAQEAALPVAGDPVAQDVVVHAPGDVDRVDLDVTEVGDGRGDVGRRSVKQQ